MCNVSGLTLCCKSYFSDVGIVGITQNLDEIDTKFQLQSSNFDDGHSNGTTGESARCNRIFEVVKATLSSTNYHDDSLKLKLKVNFKIDIADWKATTCI